MSTKLFGAAALVLAMAASGQAYAQSTASNCQFAGGGLTEIDIPRVSMTAADLPIAYEEGFSEADLKFVWGEVIAQHKSMEFGDVDDTARGLLFTKAGPALGATTVDGKPVWRFAPRGSACEEEIISRDITSAGPSGYNFGGTAMHNDVNYTLWRKKKASAWETIIIAMAGKKGTKPTLTRVATLPVDAKAISVLPNAANGTLDLVMVGSKPRDKSTYLIGLNYKPK